MVDILRDIGIINRALDSIANIEFKDLALTRGQYLYLVRIFENPGIIQDKLAETIKVDRTTAARAIKKLESNGFIEKKMDKENKKNKRLFSTKKGEQAAAYIIKENIYSNGRALEGFSLEEAEVLSQLLQRVRSNVEGDWEYVKKGNSRSY
ncbi:MarR family winged helix-turn-helix transcriptional regulator [Enterococcus sp. BWR-S5]|uniref:MarR family winged helix-turn-helix transcriptional regulator n=1 Tax=Enterococcus sp. BWR-S5 TaxID=2787714 RepID=UPI0019236E03|nr:MarR family transcriptional regulator [Enterococcus sp. BWR-S5]MBL1224547.1 MarR family transcriptional regulator [Enterococcus sp. BWR-S5]